MQCSWSATVAAIVRENWRTHMLEPLGKLRDELFSGCCFTLAGLLIAGLERAQYDLPCHPQVPKRCISYKFADRQP
jgi:hypothetical protein